MSISLLCARVDHKVINNAKGQHDLEVSNANFLCPHKWKLPLQKIKPKLSVAIFSCRAVVGNMTTIMATIDV